MPVPSSLNDLSTTPSLNSPAGSESPALVDDYLRTHAAFIKQVSDSKDTLDAANVKLTGDQTIAGTKTFSSPVIGSTSTQVSLTGDQTIAGIKTFNDNPTFSAGTANGVLYLNGSKVATSGSALTFDGTIFSANQINIKSANNLRLLNSDNTNSAGIWNPGSSGSGLEQIAFSSGGSEQMRLTSTGLGIGTSSPSDKLHVVSTARISGTGALLNLYNAANTDRYGYLYGTAGGLQLSCETGGASNIQFLAGGSEQMRLTSTGLGIGTSSPIGRVDAVANGYSAFVARAPTAGVGQTVDVVKATDSVAAYFAHARYGALSHAWLNDGATAMTLDASGNLGIGTSSPGVKLQLNGSDTTSGVYIQKAGAAQSFFGAESTWLGTGTSANTVVASYGSTDLLFGIAGVERMRLNASGNLGLGVTPGAWGASYKTLQVTNSGLAAYNSQSVALVNNAYDTGAGAWKYFNSSPASFYNQSNGIHAWYTAPSGTAGNAISFTQAMTLDASGNLGVGTAAPFWRLALSDGTTNGGMTPNGGNLYFGTKSNHPVLFRTNDTDRMTLDSSGNLGLGVTPSAWGGSLKALQINTRGALYASSTSTVLSDNVYNDGSAKYVQTAAAASYLIGVGSHQWFVAPSGTAGNAISFTQAMTLDASGNLGVGTTSPADAQLTTVASVNASSGYCGFRVLTNGTPVGRIVGSSGNEFRIDSLSTNPLTFYTNGAERARIDSSGNLLVGQTSSGAQNSKSHSIQPNGIAVVNHSTSSISGDYYSLFCYNASAIGSISQNGTTAVAYNTTSDHRLKENVRPADAARFMDIEFVDFEWTDGRHDCGVIAHQLQSVYPDLVLGEKDATETRTVEITPAVPEVKDEEGNVITEAVPAVTEEQTFPVYQQVNYIGLIGRMGTRVQQLQRTVDAQAAMLAALEARLAALEAA